MSSDYIQELKKLTQIYITNTLKLNKKFKNLLQYILLYLISLFAIRILEYKYCFIEKSLRNI